MLGLDALHRFSDEQSLVAGAVASTNVYDDEQDRNLVPLPLPASLPESIKKKV